MRNLSDGSDVIIKPKERTMAKKKDKQAKPIEELAKEYVERDWSALSPEDYLKCVMELRINRFRYHVKSLLDMMANYPELVDSQKLYAIELSKYLNNLLKILKNGGKDEFLER